MSKVLAVASFSLMGSVVAAENTELAVDPSPVDHRIIQLASTESVLDTDVSPRRTVTAVLIRSAESQSLRFWDFVGNKIVGDIKIPSGTKIGAIAWHPHDEGLYAIQHKGNDWQIVRLATDATGWNPVVIYRAAVPLRRMVFSRQKFAASYLSRTRNSIEYRLYFGAQAASGKWEMRTIRESGESAYVLAGPAPISLPLAYKEDPDSKGNQFTLSNPLPSSFHPSGSAMVIQDEKGCFAEMNYREWLQGQSGLDGDHKDDWERPQPLLWNKSALCGGSLTYTPNGTGFFHWQKGEPGLAYLNRKTNEKKRVADDVTFISTPSSTADGKGVVGVTQTADKGQQVEYVPVDVPLGDVLNAWMFIQNQDEQKAYSSHGGLLRPANRTEQLYELFDEEAYSNCGNYPKRPYLITTDLFWENFGAAFESAFILNERYMAVPAFTRLVNDAHQFFKQQNATHRIAKAFAVAARILTPPTPVPPEVAQEADAAFAGTSGALAKLLGEPVSYNQFRPRGHYVKTETNRRYFSAMRYLSSLHLKDDEARLIAGLPATIQQQAKMWVDAYRPFIAAPRAPLAWANLSIPPAKHLKKPSATASLFPLSWSRDNEVFYNTTAHSDVPDSIEGRGLPSGLDLAFVFGSDYAKAGLSNELALYPKLADRLDALRREVGTPTENGEASLYDSWINGLASQWNADTTSPDSEQLRALNPSSKDLWTAKRLQTGLASWATLRHTTLLVNDQSAAEGGQGGFSFEALVLPPPRGYVEPDPGTFKTISSLYEKLISTLTATSATWPKNKETLDLQNGLLAQLNKSRQLVNRFGDMAARLVKGETLSEEEYRMIEKIGGAIEHDFLLIKSVQVKDNGLALPDPVAKIADVAQVPSLGLSLEVAVGRPMEWDQIVPFHGKRELVRGAVYSYYEFPNKGPLTDEEWRKKEQLTPHPAWVQPFFIKNTLGCQRLQQ